MPLFSMGLLVRSPWPRAWRDRNLSRRQPAHLADPRRSRASDSPRASQNCSDNPRLEAMQLVSFRHAGAHKFGAAVDGGIVDLSERTAGHWSSLRAAIAGKALDKLAAAAKGMAADFKMDEVELLPAIPDPEKIL